MVNNNLTPKVEEIREIKYETPSYEEFMKNYKFDKVLEDNYETEWQDRVLHGPQYGPGFFGDLTKGVAATALAVSYFTPAVIVTGPLTVGAGILVAANEIKNDGKLDEVGEHVKDITVGAVVEAAGIGMGMIPGVSRALTRKK